MAEAPLEEVVGDAVEELALSSVAVEMSEAEVEVKWVVAAIKLVVWAALVELESRTEATTAESDAADVVESDAVESDVDSVRFVVVFEDVESTDAVVEALIEVLVELELLEVALEVEDRLVLSELPDRP